MYKAILFILFYFISSGELLSQSKISDSIPDRLQWDKTKKNSKELNTLLSNPLNLQKFKQAKSRRSNSGGGPRHNYLHKPSYSGFYYFYFLFEQHLATHGPRITTYKKGNEVGGYMDTSEVFIQLACDTKDKDLSKANLLAYTEKEIIKLFGENYLKKDSTLIYQYNKTILIISFSQYHWFKIAKIKKNYTSFDEIGKEKDLLSYY